MLPRNRLHRIQIAFDDHRLVNNAGLILPATLPSCWACPNWWTGIWTWPRPGPGQRGRQDHDPGAVGSCRRRLHRRCGRSALWRYRESARLHGEGAIHARDLPAQLDRGSRELLTRAWGAGAGPGDEPLTIDLDSTVCETYGLAKEGAQRHNYAGQRGYHPLVAVAAGTGDVLMARLRKGRANTGRGAANFLRETIGHVRYAGATGALTVRADSGFYMRDIAAVCRKLDVRFSITVRQNRGLRELIETIPETDWTPIPYSACPISDVSDGIWEQQAAENWTDRLGLSQKPAPEGQGWDTKL